jgi:tetratricopeptide (TPR) repeat protein
MRMWLVWIAILAPLVGGGSSAHAEQRYAIVIGANPGWSSDRPLRYAEHDAERVRDVLVTLGGFAPDRVALLRDPDTAEVRATLRDVARTAKNSGDDTLVFFYYSGHADDERLHLRGEPLSHKELHATLRGLSATIKLAVIDACKSGAVTRKGAARVDEFALTVDNPKLSGMVILTSSGADELSQESRALAGSVFTHHLVSGLRGAADADGDQQVTVTEAYHHAYTRTRADTAAGAVAQRPAFRYELSGHGELVLTRLEKVRSARVTVPRGSGIKYLILDRHEWRLIAEARADKDRDVVIALAPGPYRIKKVLADRLEVASLALAAGERTVLDSVAYKSAPLAEGIVKGDPTELSPEDYREWQRSHAFGLLADGQASAAVAIFDQLLRDTPDDLLAWRGRARALVRTAEAYQRVGDLRNERLALSDALKADPQLVEDPMFRVWYQRLGELEAREKAVFDARQELDQAVRQNPRTEKRVGVGFDLISGRGAMVVSVSAVLKRMVFPRVAMDLAGPGLDLGVVLAPFPSRWSPFLGLGGHLSFASLGLGLGGGDGMVSVNESSYSYSEMYGRHARVEAGAQFVSRAGFTTELGLAMIMFETRDGTRVQQMMPILHFGWLW